MQAPRSTPILLVPVLALLLAGCGSSQQPPPEDPRGPAPAATPEAPPARPAAPPPRDPSQPPPEVEAGCLPECTWVAGKCQALVDPGPAFGGDGDIDSEQEREEEISPGPKKQRLVRPCQPHCCREQEQE